MVKSFMLLLHFARSLKKDQPNPCSTFSRPTNNVENDKKNVVAVGGYENDVEHEIQSVLKEDISCFWAQDNNNYEPALPVNIPILTADSDTDDMFRQPWGSEPFLEGW